MHLPSVSRADADIIKKFYSHGFFVNFASKNLEAIGQGRIYIRPDFGSLSSEYSIYLKLFYKSEYIDIRIEKSMLDFMSTIYMDGWQDETNDVVGFSRRLDFIANEILAPFFKAAPELKIVEAGALQSPEVGADQSSLGLLVGVGSNLFPVMVSYLSGSHLAESLVQKMGEGVTLWQRLPLSVTACLQKTLQISDLSELHVGAAFVLQSILDDGVAAVLQIDGFSDTACHINDFSNDNCRPVLNNRPQLKGGNVLTDGTVNQDSDNQTDNGSQVVPTPNEVTSNQSIGLSDMGQLPVSVIVELGARSLTLADVSDLAAGSIIDLNIDLSSALPIRVNGHVVGQGQLIKVEDKIAIQITRWNR